MKGDPIISRMTIVMKWKSGDVTRTYSSKDHTCQSRFKKWLGWILVRAGSKIIFGRKGWKTYINRPEEDSDVDVKYSFQKIY